MEQKLNHFDEKGNAVMVDVTDKAETERRAVARGTIHVTREIFDAIASGTVRKGDVLGTARIAGILAAKQTPHLIPMCHPLLLTKAVKLDGIRESANFLTANMAFLFLPNVVGVMEYGDLLKRYALPLFLISMISTVLTFSATALSVTAVLRLMERRKQHV